MRLHSTLRLLVLALLLAVAPTALAWAQATTPMTPAAPPTTPAGPPSPGTATPAAADGSSAVAVVVVVIALLVVVGIGVKLYDLKRKREAEGVHLQAQISDALLREPALFGLPITPTAHVPFFRGSPATIEIAGQVPTSEMRENVLRIVHAEASRLRPDFQIEDRLAVVPSVAVRSA